MVRMKRMKNRKRETRDGKPETGSRSTDRSSISAHRCDAIDAGGAFRCSEYCAQSIHLSEERRQRRVLNQLRSGDDAQPVSCLPQLFQGNFQLVKKISPTLCATRCHHQRLGLERGRCQDVAPHHVFIGHRRAAAVDRWRLRDVHPSAASTPWGSRARFRGRWPGRARLPW